KKKKVIFLCVLSFTGGEVLYPAALGKISGVVATRSWQEVLARATPYQRKTHWTVFSDFAMFGAWKNSKEISLSKPFQLQRS
ncbi:MAG: hypothetical protein J5803_04670, partial [Desulfovibrio sp.]|nr:hypothetical protein [Desulfovibrio sp.]